MKKYEAAVMEIVEVNNNDVITTSINPSYSTNYSGGGLPGLPIGGGSGNVGAECCN